MLASEIFMLTNTRLTLVAWQQAIDRQRFLVPLVLDQVQPGSPAGLWKARLGGRNIDFRLRAVRLPEILGDDAASTLARWRYGFAASGTGDIGPVAVGGVALLAYAVATGGVFYDRSAGVMQDIQAMRPALEAMLAIAIGRPALSAEKDPTFGEIGGSHAMTIVTRRAS